MKKLLLTSAGFENPKVRNEFLELVNKQPSEIKVLFIPTAARTEEELHYVNKSKKELLDLGMKQENIIDFNLDSEPPKEFDVIYVCGGNTFYLLHKTREKGFDEILKNLVNKGKVYVGVSAGSIIAGPDISIATIGETSDENDVGLKDLVGLNLTDVVVSPHFSEKEREAVEEFKKNSGYQVLTLTDKQALLIIGDEKRVVE